VRAVTLRLNSAGYETLSALMAGGYGDGLEYQPDLVLLDIGPHQDDTRLPRR
jgi:hypothetical protein